LCICRDSAENGLLCFIENISYRAVANLANLSTVISEGTLAQRVNSDIAARKEWLAAFKSAAAFFDKHPPFEIWFVPELEQEGEIDYANETVDLTMLIWLSPSESGWEALNTLLSGLDKTGRRKAWGFDNLPLKDPTPSAKDAVVFGGKESFSFKVDVNLVNEAGKTIGKSSVTLESGKIYFYPGDKKLTPPSGNTKQVKFSSVKAADLTDTINIVISAVNGIPSRKLSDSGYMRIAPDLMETAEDYKIRGDAYYYKEDYDKAVADYTQAIKLDPDNASRYPLVPVPTSGKKTTTRLSRTMKPR